MFGSLLSIRTNFANELEERRKASVKTEKLGTKVSQIGFSFVFYSLCKTKEADHCMNAIGDSIIINFYEWVLLRKHDSEILILSDN